MIGRPAAVRIERRSEVTLIVSRAELVEVPDVIGRQQARRSQPAVVGLIVNVEIEDATSPRDGDLQDPAAGRRVERAS